MSQPTHGGTIWTVEDGAANAAQPAYWRKDGGVWDVGTVGPAQGRWYDAGDGSFTLFDVTAEYYPDGLGGFVIPPGGVPSYVYADDGAGGFIVSPTLTLKAARLYADASGTIRPVRLNAAELEWAKIGDHFQSF